MNSIHISHLRDEGESICACIAQFEVRCHAYAARCIQDMDQGQESEGSKDLMWRSLKDISSNMTTARASLQIANGICQKLQKEAVETGVWE